MNKIINKMPLLRIKRFFSAMSLLIIMLCIYSCNGFLDVVPQKKASLEKAFDTRNNAEKFLYTLYSYLPRYLSNGPQTDYSNNLGIPAPAFTSSDEFWGPSNNLTEYKFGQFIATGQQKVVDPYFNYWEGSNGGTDLYEAVRKCNVFLKNIHNVPDMTDAEKKRWKAEAKFLKAYYYFFLIRMYGPVVLYKQNVPISAPSSVVQEPRSPVDEGFKYVLKLLNEVIHTPQLPARIENRQRYLGRISKSIAYSIKALVWVTWASPFFNGNSDYAGFVNTDGEQMFDQTYHPVRWDSAAIAAKEAIEFVRAHGFSLYQYHPLPTNAAINDTTRLKLTLRNSFASGYRILNTGAIWVITANSGEYYEDFVQRYNIPRGLNPEYPTNNAAYGRNAPPLKIVKLFYSEHGVPIKQDKTWDYSKRFTVQKVDPSERFYMRLGYKTAYLNMHRGPRFYAYLGFDGNIWYGNGMYNGGIENYRTIKAKHGQINAISTHHNLFYSITGYWIKKLVNYRTVLGPNNSISANLYHYKLMRLANLYLLYAEAKNEADGPSPQVYKYLNLVREQAGLPTVQESWSNWSTNPNQYTTKAGLRKIIRRERSLTLLFEGQRFWDMRRWKTYPKFHNKPIRGWSISKSKAKKYYEPRTIYDPNFRFKDYLWPISEEELMSNPNIKQNPGWAR